MANGQWPRVRSACLFCSPHTIRKCTVADSAGEPACDPVSLDTTNAIISLPSINNCSCTAKSVNKEKSRYKKSLPLNSDRNFFFGISISLLTYRLKRPWQSFINFQIVVEIIVHNSKQRY